MDRLERLVNLVAALLDAGRPLSREDLRERVGGYSDDPDAFRRNFERDKDALRQMGMPLVVEPLEGDHPDAPTGYRIPRERYELPDLGLTEDELAALRVAASAVQIQGGESATSSALRKLAAGIAPASPGAGVAEVQAVGSSAAPLQVPSKPAKSATNDVGPVAEVPAGDTVATLFAAVSDRRRVTFDYRGRRRTVEPWRLAYRSGQWYLSGLDRDRAAERVFRLDRVEGEVTGVGPAGAFARPETASVSPPPPWRLGDEPETTVRLLVDEAVALTAVAAVGEEGVVERRPDGSVVLSLAVTNRSALDTFVLGFLERAEILGPPEERARFVRTLETLAVAMTTTAAVEPTAAMTTTASVEPRVP